MKVYKEKQFLVFDFEDGKNVKYNLATNEVIGKKGKPVSNLCSQLSGYTIDDIVECCVDENYGRFLKFVKERRSKDWYNISNIGTILNHVADYSKYEQIFSAGIKSVKENIRYEFKDIPKGLIKLCKEKDFPLSNNLIANYIEMPNVFNTVFDEEYNEMTENDICNVLSGSTNNSHIYKDGIFFSKVITLVKEYKYNAISMFHYFDKLMTYEALAMSEIISNFYDYVEMLSKISPRFDKYPRNLLTSHSIACRTYSRIRRKFDEAKFKEARDESLELSVGKYKFYYPKTVQDIKDEAVQMHNCVASYIDKVINGECHILFLRMKDSPDKSLITIEVRNNHIVQAYRHCNTPITEEDRLAIDKWNEKFNNEKESVA